MAFEKITAYKLDTGEIVTSLDQATMHDRKEQFSKNIRHIMLAWHGEIETSSDVIDFMIDNRHLVEDEFNKLNQ